MRITLEPTEAYTGDFPYQTVTISVPGDDLDIEQAVELLKSALIAWGFHPNNVTECIKG